MLLNEMLEVDDGRRAVGVETSGAALHLATGQVLGIDQTMGEPLVGSANCLLVGVRFADDICFGVFALFIKCADSSFEIRKG